MSVSLNSVTTINKAWEDPSPSQCVQSVVSAAGLISTRMAGILDMDNASVPRIIVASKAPSKRRCTSGKEYEIRFDHEKDQLDVPALDNRTVVEVRSKRALCRVIRSHHCPQRNVVDAITRSAAVVCGHGVGDMPVTPIPYPTNSVTKAGYFSNACFYPFDPMGHGFLSVSA